MRRQRFGDTPPADLQQQWLLLWDGDCGFCRRSVLWVMRRPGTAARIAPRPWQGETAWLPAPVRQRSAHQIHLRGPEGLWWGGGDAAIALLAVLGHKRLAAVLGLPLLRQVVGTGYRLVAGHRRFFSRFF